jgi:phage terminase large subunit-like protein
MDLMSRGQAAWDNLMLGLRLGTKPRTLVTTPKPIPLLSGSKRWTGAR